jgi:LysR family glycine cleavage system transcriptional activator
LSALRSFEAVEGQLSFSKAAQELHVTPGAVSQQIRGLEELLGSRLFNRTKGSVALTDTASRMLPQVQAGLEILARAVKASKWLLPRLASFMMRTPILT